MKIKNMLTLYILLKAKSCLNYILIFIFNNIYLHTIYNIHKVYAL